jgi:hypothetical protein
MLTRKDKEKYRASREWRNFRDQMKERQKVCALCGAPLKGRWNLHHIHNCTTIEEYMSHNPNDFLCMCNECHKFGHWIARKKSNSKWIVKIKQCFKAINFGDDWIKFY